MTLKRLKRGLSTGDEIDKIARKSDNPSITRDDVPVRVQQALLKIFGVRLPVFRLRAAGSIRIRRVFTD